MRTPARRFIAAAGLALLGGVTASAASCTLDVMGTALTDEDGGDTTGEGGGGGQGHAGGGGATHTGGSGGEGGAGGALAICGDGVLGGGESCEDGNEDDGDGCTDCVVDEGFSCSAPPSICTPVPPIIVVAGPDLDRDIQDNESYDGTLASMTCVPLAVAASPEVLVRRVELEVGIDHNKLGDLVIKLISPSGQETTVMSRPGVDDPVDAAFDSNEADDSNLKRGFPVRFAESATVSAEEMGADLGVAQVVCEDDQLCSFKPAPESGEPFSSLLDDPAAGTWQVCVADGESGNSGDLELVTLSVWAW
ncbi:proprotein convertase P-domain-containing protein [Chondromyces apiculatus]|uniref:P/Homo B domain-containing protein n=1 Tax=Chondromyces apiculatus DSM 436 TaxID=1192034 RepID=A0A017T2H8_9BACT|nr:proprotein convertase P-domain-containing protein [Chondromyces apiculatus]EYF03464.1 Hypothetical protein CAP_5448 [Chondromyces apiculatus DSM 436]